VLAQHGKAEIRCEKNARDMERNQVAERKKKGMENVLLCCVVLRNLSGG
jgi:hypothetical protein